MPRRRFAVIVAAALSAGALPPAQAGEVRAAYSDLDLDACELLEEFDQGGGEYRCGGHGGVALLVTEGDLRFDVDFGASDGRFDSFSPFNSPGERVEWRLDGDRPFAAILRFSIAVPDNETGLARPGSVLGVFKVGSAEAPGCPLAYVDAHLNANANRIARQVADAFARSFRCGEDRATYVGETGENSGNASATLPGD